MASRSRKLLHGIADEAARLLLFPKDGFVVPLASPPQEGCPIAVVRPEALWSKYNLAEKARFLSKGHWAPGEKDLARSADHLFSDELFGASDDLGDVLMDFMREHWQHRRQFDALNESDLERANALRTYTAATNLRFRGLRTSPPLNLRLLRRAATLCLVVAPMLVKIPITTLRFYIGIDVHFAFNEIRRSGHPAGGDIIALIYDLLFLQQKIAVTLKNLLQHTANVRAHKGDALLVAAELDAIVAADTLFGYEKASVEKTMALVGHTLLVELDNKKEHKKRLQALEKAFPESARNTPYAELLFAMVQSEALKELNDYRSGLLHKKGIAELQPHNYAGKRGDENGLLIVFSVLHEQHSRNTAILLAALALLTDDLVKRAPPKELPRALREAHPKLLQAAANFLVSVAEDPTSENWLTWR